MAGRALREVPVAERPRERLALRGPGGLTAAELIALLWGSGARGVSAVDLAADALARHEGLTGLARASEVELSLLPGIGAAKAAQLAAAFELGRRLLADWPAGRWSIRSPGTSRIGSSSRWVASSGRSCGPSRSTRRTSSCASSRSTRAGREYELAEIPSRPWVLLR